MAFYYIKTGGTATGDAGRYATKQTGSFAGLGTANYYNNADNALAATTSPVANDVFVYSDLHNFDNGGTAITRVFPDGAGIQCISVSDAAIDSYSAGAIIQTNGVIRYEGNSQVVGITLDTAATIEAGVNSFFQLKNSTVNLTTGGDALETTLDGSAMEISDCTVSCLNSNSGIRASNGGLILMNNTTFTGANLTNLILTGSHTNGGSTIKIFGSDLSTVTGTLNGDGGTQTTDDFIDIRIDQCQLAAGVTYSVDFSNYNQQILVTRSSDSNTSSDWQYYKKTFVGEVEAINTIYRNEDQVFTRSGERVSYEVTTNANCSAVTPLVFEMPIGTYTLLSANNTLTFYLTSNSALTDQDIYIEVTYSDGTNTFQPNFATSQSTDLFSDGTTLTTDATSTWTGGLTNNYQIDVDLSGDAGSDCLPIIKVHIQAPSVTLNFASDYGVS